MNRALFPDLKAFELSIQIFDDTGGTEKVDKIWICGGSFSKPSFPVTYLRFHLYLVYC